MQIQKKDIHIHPVDSFMRHAYFSAKSDYGMHIFGADGKPPACHRAASPVKFEF